MVTENYRFADVAFTLQMQYPYLEKQCRSYEVEEPGILIAASDEEIEREDQSGVSSRMECWRVWRCTVRFQKLWLNTIHFCFTVPQLH